MSTFLWSCRVVQACTKLRGDDGEIKKRWLGVLVMSAEKAWWSWGRLMRRCEAGTEERFEKERMKTWAFEEEQTERRGGEGESGNEQRCATKQNLSRSLSSAITVETSLFLCLFSRSHIFSVLRLERGNQRGWERQGQRERRSRSHWAVRGALRKQAVQFAVLFNFLSSLLLTPSSSSSRFSRWQNTLYSESMHLYVHVAASRQVTPTQLLDYTLTDYIGTTIP